MRADPLKIVVVSTPIGHIGSGKGGGVELTICSLVKGLLSMNHKIILLAPDGSFLSDDIAGVELRTFPGIEQPSWQQQDASASVVIPPDAVLLRLWEEALDLGATSDCVINLSYDWLPIWLTPHVNPKLFHLISMGAVSNVMKKLIQDLFRSNPLRFAFHTNRQALDYELPHAPVVVGNGFNLENYLFSAKQDGYLGWAGRIAPEKGLEDAVTVAAGLGDKLFVWGLVEDYEYARSIEKSVPPGTVEWRGFLPTDQFQNELRECRALINTPKWNEAYGNVVVEALACGVPVIAYDRGGPGELIQPGKTGFLVPPDDVDAMKSAVSNVSRIDRNDCRNWVKESASHIEFSRRVESWILKGMYSENHLID